MSSYAGAAGPDSVVLGCESKPCPLSAALEGCPPKHHLCDLKELYTMGLSVARAQVTLRCPLLANCRYFRASCCVGVAVCGCWRCVLWLCVGVGALAVAVSPVACVTIGAYFACLQGWLHLNPRVWPRGQAEDGCGSGACEKRLALCCKS